LNELVDKNVLSMDEAIAKVTSNPAKIFSLKDRGSLSVGSFADITIIDPNMEYEYKKEDILSKSKNSPFIGRKFKGAVWTTIVGGKLSWTLKDGIIK
jgi:dihydroorotase